MQEFATLTHFFHISFSLQILNDCQRLLLAVVSWFWLLSKKILFQFFNKWLLAVKSLGGWFSVSSPGNLPLENIPSVSPHPTHTEKHTKKRPIDKAGGCLQWSWTLWLSGLMFLCLESPYHPPFKQLKKNPFPLSWQLQECRYCVCKSRRAVKAFGSSFYDNTQC